MKKESMLSRQGLREKRDLIRREGEGENRGKEKVEGRWLVCTLRYTIESLLTAAVILF